MFFEYYCENCDDVFELPYVREEPVRCPDCLQWEAYINEDWDEIYAHTREMT